MKKTYLLIGISLLVIIVSLFNLTMNIESKGHYFGNGVMLGIGLSTVVVQFLKLRKQKK